MNEKLDQLRLKKYDLEKQQLKLAEQIRYEELLEIEKRLMPPIPFGFVCFELDFYGEIREKKVDRIEIDYCEQWRFYSGSNYLFTVMKNGQIDWGNSTYETREAAQQKWGKIQEKQIADKEKERLEKIEAAKRLLAETN